jgi:5-(carboxyamino)imidazole ribonucleotide mutase
MSPKKVAVVMGSDSDLPVLKSALDALKRFEIPFSVRVISAHRTPKTASDFASSAEAEGYGVIIAAAGKAAHLAGAIAANTTLPVIGIPVKSSTLDGLDALLSTVQMPSGIPVATVAIDGALNAAVLAAQILALSDTALRDKLIKYRENMALEVHKKDLEIQKEGYGL